ncbi:TetR/AcrR family transcriptional regulator [Mesorhizobium sp. YC-39]|uniref:TetR/AcrR family transcriptional regulator n=1 Tax=unclassified Mesorhizobium TaxID=325217 RepID=UPI0021E979A6|nr:MULTISPECIES: TetR/AcrR family transcriptional regulator [unclassified Mesorhizobium]MCV3209824.1 TetR/AcrR family transcriptional regulator [Mesorhizobium sp. YC-2]MCV3230354.1 TetR/AcrR family transcriptional regulator [Mesorhizobium sp. YC-39]
MRKSKEETAETRKRIVAAASEEFRRGGIDGTGLADLMGAAGLTHGGFYKHFGSKEQVVEESLALAIGSMLERIKGTMAASPGDGGLRAAIADYLSVEYRDNVAGGCPFVALGSEMARGGDAVRNVATTGFLEMTETIAGQLEDLLPEDARNEALVMLSTMIGAATIARFVSDPDLSETVLRQAREHLTKSS